MTESRNDAAAYTAADVGFHMAVARATLNPLLPTLLAPLATLIVKGMFESHRLADAVSRGIAAHAKVLRAIKRHDAAGARRAMAAHLQESQTGLPRESLSRPRPAPRRPKA